MRTKSNGGDRYEWTFTGRSKAPPEQVYEVLSDLQTHLEWAGDRQFKSFRLLSLETPSGPAGEGTTFESVGTIPMNRARFANQNTVTKVDPPRLFEITTESAIAWSSRPPGDGTFVNRFEILPDGEGSRVAYTSEQLRFKNPPWGLRYPLLRTVTSHIWIPIWSRRGFLNLLRVAEERSMRPAGRATQPH
jgi:uncharacterized protein YndB with AHSA1/START domain